MGDMQTHLLKAQFKRYAEFVKMARQELDTTERADWQVVWVPDSVVAYSNFDLETEKIRWKVDAANHRVVMGHVGLSALADTYNQGDAKTNGSFVEGFEALLDATLCQELDAIDLTFSLEPVPLVVHSTAHAGYEDC